MELDVTIAVNSFREVLFLSWPVVSIMASDDKSGSFTDDWMQANWERLVESSIDIRFDAALEIYGNGADCNIASSRVWKPNALPTTPVYVRYVGNEELNNSIDGRPVSGVLCVNYFSAIVNGWPSIDIPFDHVVVSTDDSVAIPTRDLLYYVIV